MDIKLLRSRWGWTTLSAVLTGGVLAWVGGRLTAATCLGILDLEFATTKVRVEEILAAWRTAGVIEEAGFMVGFDYLFMPFYGLALFYGALAAREAWARSPRTRQLLMAAAIAPLIAAGLDAVENILEARMLFVGLDPDISGFAYAVTIIKFALAGMGLAAALAGLVAMWTGKLPSVSQATGA
jgi:hypothetical protein